METYVNPDLAQLVVRRPSWTRRNGTVIAPLNSRGTLPSDGRRKSGQPFYRTQALKRSIDTFIQRSVRPELNTQKLPTADAVRVLNARAKRIRKANILAARGHL